MSDVFFESNDPTLQGVTTLYIWLMWYSIRCAIYKYSMTCLVATNAPIHLLWLQNRLHEFMNATHHIKLDAYCRIWTWCATYWTDAKKLIDYGGTTWNLIIHPWFGATKFPVWNMLVHWCKSNLYSILGFNLEVTLPTLKSCEGLSLYI